MRKKPWKACIRTITIFFCIFFCFLSSCKKTNSKQPQVVLYCSVDQNIAEPIIAHFEKQYNIKVLARYDTEATKTVGLVQRLRAEASATMADIFWSSEVFHTIRLAEEGLFAPYHSDQTVDWPRNFSHPKGFWYGFALRGRVIAYHTDRVPTAEAPRSLEDLLDKKWRGRIVMANPKFGTTGGDVASWFVHYGPDRARSILRQLKNNEIRIVDGNSTAVKMVHTGQADICLTDTDDVYAAQRNGWPIAMNFLDQNNKGPLAIPNTASLLKGAPHPQAARVLMDFLLSEQLEQLLARSDSHNAPIHPNLAEEFQQYLIKHPLEIDYEKVAQQLPTAKKTAGEILP